MGHKDGGARFAALSQRIADILHPDSLTPHGYVRTFVSRDQYQILSSMASVIDVIETHGYPIFIYAGTLLGLVREGKLIDHDNDLDLAVFLGEIAAEDVPEIWLKFKRKLVATGVLSDKQAAEDKAIFRVQTESVEIDLFPAWSEEGKFSVYPYCFGELDNSDVFPTKLLVGTGFSIPCDEEAFLSQCYGKTWRVPDPRFKTSWRKANKRFGCLLQFSYALKTD